MVKLKQDVDHILLETCSRHKLQYNIKWFDYFPTVVNDNFCNQLVTDVAKTNDYDIVYKSAPFKFGEDFGWFSGKYKTAMFGVGAGLDSPALHQADYDFPDEIIETGMNMFKGIIEKILTQEK